MPSKLPWVISGKWRCNSIGCKLFEGNIFERNTFIPILQRMEKRFNLGKPIVIADSGML